jgi:hypothetical protein
MYRKSVSLMLGVAFVFVLAFASTAFAEEPWWHLTSGARPAYLHAGGGKPGTNAVFKLVETGEEGGSYFLEEPVAVKAGKEIEGPEPGATFIQVPSNATAAELQHGLEEIEAYGAGNVIVKEVAPNEFTIEIIERAVSLGQEGSATVTQTATGAPRSSDGELYMTAENLGNKDVEGKENTVTLTDVIPHGLKAVGVAATKPFKEGNFQAREPISCSLEEKHGTQIATCTFKESLAPYDQLEMRIGVNVESGAASGETNSFSVSGGDVREASVSQPITISTAPVPFALEKYEMDLEEEGGAPSEQAGAHPFQFTTTLAFDQLHDIAPLANEKGDFRPEVLAPALAKDLHFNLPPGLIGNPTPIPQCTTAEFYLTFEGRENACPPDTAVGAVNITIHEPAVVGTVTVTAPLFNLEPRVGEPARFGFYVVISNTPVFIDTSLRNGADYGVTGDVTNITQQVAFLSSEVTFWGVPNASSHDNQRGWGCMLGAREETKTLYPCTPLGEAHPPPFLVNPTQCTSSLGTSATGDSWEEPGNVFDYTGTFSPAEPLTGCNELQFAPQLKVAPDAEQAAKPTGLTVDVHVPQEVNENAAGDASANVKDITVKFPQGVVLNPSAADGLQACTEGQVGLAGGAKGAQDEFLFAPGLPNPFCPDASKIGTVTIKSPLLPKGQNVEGSLYLATPAPNGEAGNNPFNSLVSMYIVAEDPISGALIKLPGSVSLDPSTGQITSTFENNPQLAFEDAEIHLFGGERAPLATPSRCGTYETEALYTPWSGTAPVRATSAFRVTSGPNGTPCPGASLPFSPSFAGGVTNVNAGAFSNLTTTFGREDGNQDINRVQLHFPPGLSGILTGIPLCGEAEANAGTCSEASKIGETIVSVGLGGDPFSVTGGKVYLTGPYHGAPFGLSIVNPAVAGPFDLGKVIVRAKIEVDPHTAALTVTTNNEGEGFAIPHILDGIPLQIKHINVTIDRPGFTFNPTNCSPQAITGSLGSNEGATASFTERLQVTNCANLKFTPKFTVTTAGKNSKAGGATLTAKLSEPAGAQGTQSNITRVKVDLPKQLPSRLTTLQKACTSAQFELNPANCPKESKIGFAKVTTPLLPVPLEGPAIFVSHGNESFPSLTMVLQGYGVTVDLVGTTFISKAGITSTTFKTVPDVPFNTFTLTLGQGKFSALAASVPTKDHYSLCGQTLNMPTEFLAQNGAKINQTTKVGVSGCKKAKKAKAKKGKKQAAAKKKSRK